MLLLSESEIRSCVGLDAEALAAVEQGFVLLERGAAVLPAPIGIDVPDKQAEVHVKSAYVRGLPGFAVKIASGFYGNANLGLPSASGLMVLLDAETGHPLALLLDNGYLTDIRTALAGALAARHLAPTRIGVVGVVGTGTQARLQVRALALVRSFSRVVVWGRRPDAAQACAADIARVQGVTADVVATPDEAARQSDVLITATYARAPLVTVAGLHPGLHITAMGSDGPGKQELHSDILDAADRLVADSRTQCLRLGELQHARPGLLERKPVDELGAIAAGARPAREDAAAITVCDLTGIGVQDTAIAVYAHARAVARHLGTRVALTTGPLPA